MHGEREELAAKQDMCHLPLGDPGEFTAGIWGRGEGSSGVDGMEPGFAVPGLPPARRHHGQRVGNNLPTAIGAGNLGIKISPMISGLLKA